MKVFDLIRRHCRYFLLALAGCCLVTACSEKQVANKNTGTEEIFSEEQTGVRPITDNGDLSPAFPIITPTDTGYTAEMEPFLNLHEMDLPLQWIQFDRPIMLYIDEAPRLNDSLFLN